MPTKEEPRPKKRRAMNKADPDGISKEWKPYWEKLKDPRWQKKRLEVMERDRFRCQNCYDNEATLNVHHWYYVAGKNPWEYPNESLTTLCEDCHEEIESLRQRLMACIGLSNWGNGFVDQIRHIIGYIQGCRLGGRSEDVAVYTTSELEGVALSFGQRRDSLADWIDAGEWDGITSGHGVGCDDDDEKSWLITKPGMSEIIDAMKAEDEAFRNRHQPASCPGFVDSGWWM